MAVKVVLTVIGFATLSSWRNTLFDQAQTNAETLEPSRPALDGG
jgi:hypothetical protein